ncbi:hypothetical protein Tco_0658288 [Tanacetum coccineum]
MQQRQKLDVQFVRTSQEVLQSLENSVVSSVEMVNPSQSADSADYLVLLITWRHDQVGVIPIVGSLREASRQLQEQQPLSPDHCSDDSATPSPYQPLLPSGTPPLLPKPIPIPSTARYSYIPEADTPPRKRLLLTAPRPRCEVREILAVAAAACSRQPGPTMARRVDCSSVTLWRLGSEILERRRWPPRGGH